MSYGWKSGRRFEPPFDASALAGECLRERRGQFRIRENGISEWGIFVHTREPFYHSGNLLSVKCGYILMSLTTILIVVSLVGLFLLVVLRVKGQRDQREMEQHSITAAELHALLASNQEVLLFDVRQPLDLLAHSEIIPKAQRISPNDVLQNPSLIPREKDTVVYCTCPGDKTTRAVLRRVLALHFSRVKFLEGGLAAWKEKGYPVEPYNEVFHLYRPSLASGSG